MTIQDDSVDRITAQLAPRLSGVALPHSFFGVPKDWRLNAARLRRAATKLAVYVSCETPIPNDICPPCPLREFALHVAMQVLQPIETK